MRPRTGTHYLANLLCQHPDCTKAALAEDGLLLKADHLVNYARKLNAQWTSIAGKSHESFEELLYANLGQGLISFLYASRKQSDGERIKQYGLPESDDQYLKRLVTKTPSIKNLDLFFKLFPNAFVLVLVREGTAVVESEVRSFQSDRETSMRAWAKAADKLIEFDRNPPVTKERYLIVRYEDLFTQTESEMRRILNYLRLDVAEYDFEAAQNLPVVGSSTFKRTREKVQWLPVRKTVEFDPLSRAKDWARAWHERFNWIAGRQSEELGYTLKKYHGNKTAWFALNKMMDAKWSLKMARRRLFRKSATTNDSSRP